MMESVIDIYREPLFFWFPIMGNLVSMAAFVLFAAPLTAIAAIRPAWAEPYRIQSRRGNGADLLWPSVKRWVSNNAWMLGFTVLSWPTLRLSGIHTGPLPPWYLIVGQLLFFLYLDDFIYYWFHRGMHHQLLYPRIHKFHHKVTVPWAVNAHYMHPVEYVLTGSIMLIGPLVLGSHVVTLRNLGHERYGIHRS